MPRSLGGTNAQRNIVAACPSCNRKRGNRPLSEWLDHLKERLKKMGKHHHLEVVLSWLTSRGMHPSQVGHPGNGPDATETAASPPLMDTSPAP